MHTQRIINLILPKTKERKKERKKERNLTFALWWVGVE